MLWEAGGWNSDSKSEGKDLAINVGLKGLMSIHTHFINFHHPREDIGAVMLSISPPHTLLRLQFLLLTGPSSFPYSIASDGQWIKIAPLQAWKNIIMWSEHIQAIGDSPVYLEGHLAIRIESLKGWYSVSQITLGLLRSPSLQGVKHKFISNCVLSNPL